jgi:hypothetical protein
MGWVLSWSGIVWFILISCGDPQKKKISFLGDRPLWLAHQQKNIIKLWALPKYTCCSLLLWATYVFGKRRTLGKGYGVKCGGVWNTLGTYWELREHNFLSLGTLLKHDGNLIEGTPNPQKSHPFLPQMRKKNWSLLGACCLTSLAR